MTLSVHVGDPLVELIKIAYQADQPVLLVGGHGVGKSQILEQAAEELKIGSEVFDLSLMEPTDLVGLPRLDEGTTVFSPPARLPTTGKGLLIIEELNRAPRYVRAPCLQLLTLRRLNDYVLPQGWLPVASMNPIGAPGYQTDEVDAALLSRFAQLSVLPNVAHWLSWARQHKVHRDICQFVESSPGVFDDPVANPRAWKSASDLLFAWAKHDGDHEQLAQLLAGVLGEEWALAFCSILLNEASPLTARDIIEHYGSAKRTQLRTWSNQGKLDLVQASWEALRRELSSQRSFEKVVGNPQGKQNVECFLTDLPADLLGQARTWLADRGFDGLHLPKKRRSKR